jgi:plastocyanin
MRRTVIGLALVSILALGACGATSGGAYGGGGGAPASSPAAASAAGGQPAAGTAVQIAGFAFAPAAITVKAGTTVTWTNADGAAHTVTANDGSFDSGSLDKGATFSQTFSKAGTFAYHCTFHSGMKATITVTP